MILLVRLIRSCPPPQQRSSVGLPTLSRLMTHHHHSSGMIHTATNHHTNNSNRNCYFDTTKMNGSRNGNISTAERKNNMSTETTTTTNYNLDTNDDDNPRTTTNTNTAVTANDPTQLHYEHHKVQSTYEDSFFYEPGIYMDYLKDLVQKRLQLSSAGSPTSTKRTLLDIGGGTGNFTKLITEGTSLHSIVVDPYLEQQHYDHCNNHDDRSSSSISFVKKPAEVFMKKNDNQRPNGIKDYDYILLKEVIHHFREEDRIPILRGLYDGCLPVVISESQSSTIRPSILIITRPQHEIDYPLWPAARMVWSQTQPSSETFCNELTEAGFVNIHTTIESYSCSISVRRWKQMIQRRFWSTFSNFTDEELIAACHYIDEHETSRIDPNNMIHFEDRLVFISASKL